VLFNAKFYVRLVKGFQDESAFSLLFNCFGHRGCDRVVLLESMGMESSGYHYTTGVGNIIEGSVWGTARFLKQDYSTDQSESCCDLSHWGNHVDHWWLFVVLWFCLLTC